MEPSTGPISTTTNTTCTDCGGDLQGNRWRCPPCVEAARLAVEEAGGRTVLPSDVAGIRERTAPSD